MQKKHSCNKKYLFFKSLITITLNFSFFLAITSNLRKHYSLSKEPKHVDEWARFLALQAKVDQSHGNLTPLKQFVFKDNFSKSDTKISKLEVYASPRYSRNSEQQVARYDVFIRY